MPTTNVHLVTFAHLQHCNIRDSLFDLSEPDIWLSIAKGISCILLYQGFSRDYRVERH